MTERKTRFYLRFIYVRSTFLPNKGILIDNKRWSKANRIIVTEQSGISYIKQDLKNGQIGMVFTVWSIYPMWALLLDITRGLTVPLTMAALRVNTAQNNFLEQSLFPLV